MYILRWYKLRRLHKRATVLARLRVHTQFQGRAYYHSRLYHRYKGFFLIHNNLTWLRHLCNSRIWEVCSSPAVKRNTNSRCSLQTLMLLGIPRMRQRCKAVPCPLL